MNVYWTIATCLACYSREMTNNLNSYADICNVCGSETFLNHFAERKEALYVIKDGKRFL